MTVTELIEALQRIPGDTTLRVLDIQIIDECSGFVGVHDLVWDGQLCTVTLIPSRRLTIHEEWEEDA